MKMYTTKEADKLVAEKVKALKAENAELLADIRQSKDKLAAFAEAGITPEKVAAVRERAANPPEEPDYDKMAEALDAKHTAELAARSAQIEKQDQQLDGAFAEQLIHETVSAAEGDFLLLGPLMRRQMKVERLADGERRAVILDKEGERRLTKWALGAHDLMTAEQLVAEMKEDERCAGAFRSANGRGKRVENEARLVVDGTDPVAMGRYLGEIASGDADVV